MHGLMCVVCVIHGDPFTCTEPLFPRIVYRQLRPVAKLASTRDVVTLQDYTTFPDGAHLLYEVSVQHR